MKAKKIVVGLTLLALVVLMVPPVFANGDERPPGYSPGYWKHQLKAMFNGRGHMHEEGNMEDYEDTIANEMNTSAINDLSGDPSQFELRDAFEAFIDPSYNHMWLTIANWFNEAAGRKPYVDTD